jgi:hypothetical protein
MSITYALVALVVLALIVFILNLPYIVLAVGAVIILVGVLLGARGARVP